MQDFGLVDLPYPLRKMSLNPLGCLFYEGSEASGKVKYRFRRGVESYPTVGGSVLLPTQNQLRAIVESGDSRHVMIGTSPLAANAEVKVDELHFTNIIRNLLDNAIKYCTENPKIIISTTNSKNGITISVKDNGIGINPVQKKQVFEKFYRVPTGNVHNVKGFGLGLYYVKSLVTAHHGTVDVSSDSNGSTFKIFFPYLK